MITMDGHEINALKLTAHDGTTTTKALVETGGASGVSDFWDAYHEVINVPTDVTDTTYTTIATLNSDAFYAWRNKLYNTPCYFLCILTPKFEVTGNGALLQYQNLRCSTGGATTIGNVTTSGALRFINRSGVDSIASNATVIVFGLINANTDMPIQAKCETARMEVLKAGDYDVWLYKIGTLS